MTTRKNHKKAWKKDKSTKKTSNSADLKKAHPDQFHKIGNFSGTAKLILKEDT